MAEMTSRRMKVVLLLFGLLVTLLLLNSPSQIQAAASSSSNSDDSPYSNQILTTNSGSMDDTMADTLAYTNTPTTTQSGTHHRQHTYELDSINLEELSEGGRTAEELFSAVPTSNEDDNAFDFGMPTHRSPYAPSSAYERDLTEHEFHLFAASFTGVGADCTLVPAVCQNNATCIQGATIGNFTCVCPAAWTGPYCNITTLACSQPTNPCQNAGTCIQGASPSSYTCNCNSGVSGWTGPTCSTMLDYCAIDNVQCANGGTCQPQLNGHLCLCTVGWGGANCTVNSNACYGIACSNGGACVSTVGTPAAVNGSWYCDCPPLYSGKYCDIYSDPCAGSPCGSFGFCSVGSNYAANCTCSAGYTGTTCQTKILYCHANSCNNGGTCVEQIGGFSCDCPTGYSGNFCEIAPDPCAGVNCHNGTCIADTLFTSHCNCQTSYTGSDCSSIIPYCVANPNPCQNGGLCISNGISAFTCSCKTGVFSGSLCQTADLCVTNPCQNGGTCAGDATFGYVCTCPTGYTGANCDVFVNLCTPTSCGNNGTCSPALNSVTCSCLAGYDPATNCNTRIDHCASGQPGFGACKNGGTCNSILTGFTCGCPTGFVGQFCETSSVKCTGVVCAHGYCQEPADQVNGVATCNCMDNSPTEKFWTGNLCQNVADNCAVNPCQNGGTCVNQAQTYGTYQCTCPTGYAQPNCSSCIGARFAPNTGCAQSTVSSPKVMSAQLTNDLTWIVVQFDRSTNRLGVTSTNQVACATILATSTLATLGSAPICFWRSSGPNAVKAARLGKTSTDPAIIADTSASDQLVIDVSGSGASFTTALTDYITFLPGLLVSSDGLSVPQSDPLLLKVLLSPPPIVPTPVPVLVAPLSTPGCDSVVAYDNNSTGRAGRPFVYTWSLLPYVDTRLSDIQLANINDLLANTKSNDTISLNAYYLPPGRTYLIQMTLTNWVGGNASATALVVKNAYSIPPIVTFPAGSSYTINRAQAITINPYGYVTHCVGLTLISYSWVLASTTATDLPNFSQSRLDVTNITIAPNTLNPGQTYIFRVTVTSAILDQSTSSSADVSVSVTPVPSPTVSSAFLDANNRGLWLTFNIPTNRGQMTTASPCSVLFSVTTMNYWTFSTALGDSTNVQWQTSCQWANSTYMLMSWWLKQTDIDPTIPTAAQLIPSKLSAGATLTINAGLIKSAGGFSSGLITTDVVLNPPPHATAPIARLLAPGQVSQCDSFKLDGSNSESKDGRVLNSYLWTLNSSVPVLSSAIQSSLFAHNTGSTFSIAGAILPAGTYTFSLVVANSYLITNQILWSVNVSSAPIPTLSLTAPGINSTIEYADALTLVVDAKAACGGSSTITVAAVLQAAYPPTSTTTKGGVGTNFPLVVGTNTFPNQFFSPATTYKLLIRATDPLSGSSNQLLITVNVRAVPVPQLVSTIPSNSISKLTTTFDLPTNGTGTIDCAIVYTASTLAVLTGRNPPTCQFTTPTTLVTSLGSGVTFPIGYSIQWNTGAFFLASQNGLSDLVRFDGTTPIVDDDYETQYKSIHPGVGRRLLQVSGSGSNTTAAGSEIAAPDEPQIPSAAISAPDTISSCENITLNGASTRGGSARPFIDVTFFIQPDPLNQLTQEQYDTFNAYLLQFSTLIVTIPAGYLPPRRNYKIGLAVTNWLGYVGYAFTNVYITDTAIPLVQFLDANTRTHAVDKPLVVTTSIIRSACDNSGDVISYIWETISSPVPYTVPDYTARLTNFYIKPYSLLSNAVYQFRVTASVFGATTNSSAIVTITTQPAPIVALLANKNTTVSNGHLSTLPSNLFPVTTQGIIIDATPSYDIESRLRSSPKQNFLPLLAGFPAGGSVSYEFGCIFKVMLTSCFSTPPSYNSSEPYWYIPSTYLVDTRTVGIDGASDSYVFYVRVQYGDPSLRSSAYAAAAISYIYDSIPAGLGIKPLPGAYQLDHEVITLKAIIPTGDTYSIQWSVGATTAFNINDPTFLLSGTTSENLVLAPYALYPGTDSEFIVTIRSKTQPSLNATSANIIVSTASVPGGGYCYITPDGGVSLVDTFEAHCYDWTDDDVSAPLVYEILLLELNPVTSVEISRKRIGLGDGASVIPIAQLPPGPSTSNYTHVVRAVITNGLGAQAYYDFEVTVYPPSADITAQYLSFSGNSTAQAEFATATARGDHTSFASTLHSIVALAQSSNANLTASQLADLNAVLLTQLANFHSSTGNDSRLQSTTEGVESHASMVALVCGDAATLNHALADQCLQLTGSHITSLQTHTGSTDATDDMNGFMLSTIGEVFRTTQYGPSCGNVSIDSSTVVTDSSCTLTAPTNSTQFPDLEGYPYVSDWWNYLYYGEQQIFLDTTGDLGVEVQFALINEAKLRLSRAQNTVNTMKAYLLALSVANTKKQSVGQAASRSANKNGFLQLVSQKHDGNSIAGSVLQNYGLTSAAFTNNSAEYSITQVPCNITDLATNITSLSTCNVTSSLSGQSIKPANSVTASYATGTTLSVTAPSLGLVDGNGNSIVSPGRIISTVFTTLDYNPYGNTAQATNGTNVTIASNTASQILSFSLVDVTDYSDDTALIDGSTQSAKAGTGQPGDDGVAASPPTSITVQNLSTPFVFVIPHTSGINLTATASECQWWDASHQSWSSTGCTRVNKSSTALYTTCECIHLTDFRIGLGSPESLLHPTITLLSLTDFTNLTWANIQNHPTVFLTLLIIFGVFFIVLPLIHHLDQRRFFEVWNEEANRELHRHEVYLETGILMTDKELDELTQHEREAEVRKALAHGNSNFASHYFGGGKTQSDSNKTAQQIILESNLSGTAEGEAIALARMTPYERAMYQQTKFMETQPITMNKVKKRKPTALIQPSPSPTHVAFITAEESVNRKPNEDEMKEFMEVQPSPKAKPLGSPISRLFKRQSSKSSDQSNSSGERQQPANFIEPLDIEAHEAAQLNRAPSIGSPTAQKQKPSPLLISSDARKPNANELKEFMEVQPSPKAKPLTSPISRFNKTKSSHSVLDLDGSGDPTQPPNFIEPSDTDAHESPLIGRRTSLTDLLTLTTNVPPPPGQPPTIPAPPLPGQILVSPKHARGKSSSQFLFPASPKGQLGFSPSPKHGRGASGQFPPKTTLADPHDMMGEIRAKSKQQQITEMTPAQELAQFEKKPFLSKWYARVSHNFRYNHIYVSIGYRKKNDVLTGVEKIVVVLCYILGAMMVNAAFYQNQQNNIFAYISVAVISSAVIIPAKMFLRLIFGSSGARFEEKRNKFRQQYRKVIAAKIAQDLANTKLPIEVMDKKLGLINPTEDEREIRLNRQDEYCDLLMDENHVMWERGAYLDDTKQSLEDLTDIELLALKKEVEKKEEEQKKADKKKQVVTATPHPLTPDEQKEADNVANEEHAKAERRTKWEAEGLTPAEIDAAEAAEQQRDEAAKLRDELRAKKKKEFRFPGCCKPFMLVVAACWCLVASFLLLVYGIKFDLKAEEGGVAQESDPVARSYLWLASCSLSMAQDILINEPIILTLKAGVLVALGSAWTKVVALFSSKN